MIVVDANVIILMATIGTETGPDDSWQDAQAKSLLRAIALNEEDAYLSEIVVHEAFYTLCMTGRFNVDVPTFCQFFRALLLLPGWTMPADELAILRRAFDTLDEHPGLEFSDCAIAARAERTGARLATFDKKLRRAFAGELWP